MIERISRVEWLMSVADITAKRGTCGRLQVGCVIVKNNRIISTGYNGALPNMGPCSGVVNNTNKKPLGCNPEESCTHAIHAEMNAILACAKAGICTEGAALYCTHGPCPTCARAIIQAGISTVVFRVPFRDTTGVDLLKSHFITVHQL